MDYKPRIAVIGAGYVGLVSSACFAELGFNVICIDNDAAKIKSLRKGEPTIYEPSLTQLVRKNQEIGRLVFSHSLSEGVVKSEILIIAVGTPLKEGVQLDISEVEKVVTELAFLLTTYKIIIVKSTVPVGSCRKLSNLIRGLNHAALFDIASNPEFLRAGSSVNDFMMPDRIVIGTDNIKTHKRVNKLYEFFIDKNIPIIQTSLESAELIKYASNSFLATKIAFVNEVAYFCEKAGADVNDVLQGMGLDKRIGNDYLQPGPGFGGSCLSKDTLTLVNMGENLSASMHIVSSILKSNVNHKKRVLEKIIEACCGSVKDKRLAILGMAFKANTDDIRESPGLYIVSELQSKGAILKLYDPIVKKAALNLNVHWGMDVYDTINDTDAVIIMTEWGEFRQLDLEKIKSTLRNILLEPTLIDLRNLYSPNVVRKAGIRYCSIGRLTQNTSYDKNSEPQRDFTT